MEHIHTIVDYAVLGVLLFLSVVACALALERVWVYRTISLSRFADRRSLELHLTRKLHLLAIIGTNAPYIGLLGTVIGIMFTFYDMGSSGFDTTHVMQGLALALKATALGLLVAIPAVTFYNLLLRKCKVLLMQWDIAHG